MPSALLMVGLRHVAFMLTDSSCVFSDYWFRNLVIEYQKDIRIYVVTTDIITAYRHVRATRARAPAATVRTDRMVVQTDKGESIIRRDDIEYLEAARNYVAVSTGARDFLVRSTLAKLEEELVAESNRAHTPQLPGQHRQDRGDPHD